ncbi:Protein PTHB1 [Larimichthys crocea]|uniref:Uncharacterized protein n=1 Tax=Larimichthys crocea TaxID=215358 RepID=A0ACD3QUT6_LARCR|nr:Protein PTHB1 [Larimichthys crocea]
MLNYRRHFRHTGYKQIGHTRDLKGVVISLSSDGHLLCSYMGTDPSFFSTPKVDAREVDYEQVDAEMKKLQKYIREASRTQDILPKSDAEDDLVVTAAVSPNMDSQSQALIQDIDGVPIPSVTIQVKVKASCVVQSSKLTVSIQPPLAVTQDQFVLEPMGVGSSTVVAFSAFLNGRYPPADLTGDITVSYSSPTAPKVKQISMGLGSQAAGVVEYVGADSVFRKGPVGLEHLGDFFIGPRNLPSASHSPSQEILSDQSKSELNLPDFYRHGVKSLTQKRVETAVRCWQCFCKPMCERTPLIQVTAASAEGEPAEFSAKSEDKDGNSLAFQFLSGAKVTVLASKTSQRYRIQSDSFEDMWLVVKELVQRFDRHFTKLGVKDFKKSFSGPLPLQEYFLSVDHHFQSGPSSSEPSSGAC